MDFGGFSKIQSPMIMPGIKKLKKGLANFLQDLKEPCKLPPQGAEEFDLGKSVENRSINCYRIGRGERKILFVSAMHGNEIGTAKLGYLLLDYLINTAYKNLTCFVVPCLNVDGFAKAREWRGYFSGAKGRTNSRNVDLNRNFPAMNFRSRSHILPKHGDAEKSKYRKEVLAGHASNLTLKNCGEFGGSEPEIKALMSLVEKESISVIFSFHNIGCDVMGGKDDFSKDLVRIYADKTGYETLEDAEWRKIGQTGTLKDWCDERDISFVEVEGSTRYGSDWKIQKPALEAVLNYISGMVKM